MVVGKPDCEGWWRHDAPNGPLFQNSSTPIFSWACQTGQKRNRIITHRCFPIIFRRFVNVFSNYITAHYVSSSTIKQLRPYISPYAAQVTITKKPETINSDTPAWMALSLPLLQLANHIIHSVSDLYHFRFGGQFKVIDDVKFF